MPTAIQYIEDNISPIQFTEGASQKITLHVVDCSNVKIVDNSTARQSCIIPSNLLEKALSAYIKELNNEDHEVAEDHVVAEDHEVAELETCACQIC